MFIAGGVDIPRNEYASKMAVWITALPLTIELKGFTFIPTREIEDIT